MNLTASDPMIKQSRTYELSKVSVADIKGHLKRDFPGYLLKPHYELPLYQDLVELVDRGLKSTTIRYEPNAVRYPGSSRLLLVATSPSDPSFCVPRGEVYVRKIVIKPFAALTEKDAKTDGCANLKELRSLLTKIFGRIPDEHPVSIYSLERSDDISDKA